MINIDQFSMKSRLENITEMVNVIKSDFERNGKVHHDYILEKLSRAKWDLDGIIAICEEMKRDEANNETNM